MNAFGPNYGITFYVRELIANGKILNAIDSTLKYCQENIDKYPELENCIRKLYELKETYRYFVRYLMEGFPDDGREETYKEIKNKIYALLDNIHFIIKADSPNDPFYEIRRLDRLNPITLSSLVESYRNNLFRIDKAEELGVDFSRFAEKNEKIIVKIFNKVMTMGLDDRESLETILKVENNPQVPFVLASQIISALTLGIIRFYDKTKIETLINIYETSTNERIQARALTSLVLVIARWNSEICHDRELLSRIESLTYSIITYTHLRDIVMYIIKTRDTDRVNKKIKETFEKDLSNLHKGLDELRKNGNVFDINEHGENPEWEKLLRESGLEEKLRDINEMQLEGMDVMMQAFANLKNFPFFRETANWFLPFSLSHSNVKTISSIIDSDLFELMIKASDMCESDKYSFALGILNMPGERISAMTSQFEAAREQMNEDMKSAALKSLKNAGFNSEVKGFLRDIYRFLRLYPHKKFFKDIFNKNVDFINSEGLKNLMSEVEILNMISEYYFTYGYYKEALPLLESLIEKGGADKHIYEKVGYCYQLAAQYDKALENYEKADLFSSDEDKSSMWLIRKIALCYKLMYNYDKAAEYYLKALEREPENTSILYNLSNVLLYGENVEEARKYFSKALYLKQEDPRLIRGMAFAELKAGNVSKASEYVARLLKGNPGFSDWRIAAAYAYISKDYKTAAKYYKNGYDNEYDQKIYVKEMQEDMKFLQEHDYKPTVHEIVLEQAFMTSEYID